MLGVIALSWDRIRIPEFNEVPEGAMLVNGMIIVGFRDLMTNALAQVGHPIRTYTLRTPDGDLVAVISSTHVFSKRRHISS